MLSQTINDTIYFIDPSQEDLTVSEHYKCLKNGDKVLLDIPERFVNSSAYYRASTFDLKAAIAATGPPDYTVTLTFSESLWPERNKLLDLNYFVTQQPYLALLAIQQKLLYIKKYILGISASKKDQSLFGKSEHYFIKTEFQKRVQIHYHILIWNKNPEIKN